MFSVNDAAALTTAMPCTLVFSGTDAAIPASVVPVPTAQITVSYSVITLLRISAQPLYPSVLFPPSGTI